MDQRLKWALIGIAAIYVLKYAIVGLDGWTGFFHPGAVLAPNQGAFRRPLLGLFE